MYKVFLNDRMILIDAPGNITKNAPVISFKKETSAAEVKKWFSAFKNGISGDVFLQHPQPEDFFKVFKSIFRQLPAAGGVVRSGGDILFIFRNGKWDLPKGKIDKGENARHAALREVEEECGISGHKIIRILPSTFHIYQSTWKHSADEWIFKETSWFEMEYNGTSKGTPQTKEGITEVRWFPQNKMEEVMSNTYENLKQIIELYRA